MLFLLFFIFLKPFYHSLSIYIYIGVYKEGGGFDGWMDMRHCKTAGQRGPCAPDPVAVLFCLTFLTAMYVFGYCIFFSSVCIFIFDATIYLYPTAPPSYLSPLLKHQPFLILFPPPNKNHYNHNNK